MSSNEQDTRQAIMDTAKALLDETDDMEKITVRQIAKRAGVGIGLINYHFKSKDNLIRMAVGDVMSQTIRKFTKADGNSTSPPVMRLKEMMKELYALAGTNEKIIQFILSHEMRDGNMQTPLLLVPLLKQIFNEQKNEMELRILAMQILYPIQVTALNPGSFHLYSGIDLSNTEQRSQFVEVLIDNLIHTK